MKFSIKRKLNIIAFRKIFLASMVLGLFFCADRALAQTTYNSLVQIPGIPNSPGVTTYLSRLYTFLISAVGIVAMGAIIIGGARYLTSAGNPSAVEDAKHIINSAIFGLFLALLSWVIIKEINPDILVTKQPSMGWEATGYNPVADTVNCAVPSGNGTAKNPCACIDGSKIVSAVTTMIPTALTLAVAPNPIGDVGPTDIHMTGKLTDTSGNPISGAQIKVNKMATALNASSTFTDNTDATGNYDAFFTVNSPSASCVSNDNMQAVFAGGVINAITYSATGSNVVAFTKNSATPYCTIFDYMTYSPGGPQPVATIWSAATGDLCDQTCSDAALAAQKVNPDGSLSPDGKYHCLKVNVKIGWVSADPSTYTTDQIRALAVNTGTDSSPFIAYDQARYIFEVEKYTQSLYPIVEYKKDEHYDNKCDDLLTNPGWNISTAGYGIAPAGSTCKNSTSPKALTCSQLFCVTDSQGNQASTLIYYTILAP